MARKIAIYGKGGIGKSTVSSNLTAALSDIGTKVMQIGCDPKHDSTRGLIGGKAQNTILDYLKETAPTDRKLEDVVLEGYKGCLCLEAGGPEPGVGCAGRGIISAFSLLDNLGASDLQPDITLYDVLGDVVCGGFAVPLRNDYADTVYIVTSGEFMAIYAANNILKGIANYDPERVGGIIFNSRGDPQEYERVRRFSEAVNVPIIVSFDRSELFMEAERQGKTVVETFPDSVEAEKYRDLARKVIEGKRHTAKFLKEDELENLILGRSDATVTAKKAVIREKIVPKNEPYTAGNLEYGKAVHGCAFSGASSACTSIEGLTTVLHAPKSCAHFTVQLDSCCVRGAMSRGNETIPVFEDPDVFCTDMDESTMVFGGNDRLRNLLERLVSEGRKNFVVITACPPGIIGDDVTGVCEGIESSHPDVKIAVLKEDGNATGDFMQGTIDAAIGLTRKFSVPGGKKPLSVNLLGAKTLSSYSMSEISQVEGFLNDLGVTVNCILPGITDVVGLKDVSCAAVNLNLSTDSFCDRIAMFLKDEYGMETLTIPVRGGIGGSSDWIRCVGEYFGIQDRAEMVVQKIKNKFTSLMEYPKTILKGKTCCILTISGDSDWVMEAVEQSEMNLLKGFVLRRPDYTDQLKPGKCSEGLEEIHFEDVPRAMKEIENAHPDILMTISKADIDSSIYQSRLPCAASSDPYAGRALAEDWIRGMIAPKNEGWREDVA